MRDHGRNARLLSGGTDLLVRLKKDIEVPPVVIDLKRVSGLDGDITESGGRIRIGARAVMTDLIEHPILRAHFPALIEIQDRAVGEERRRRVRGGRRVAQVAGQRRAIANLHGSDDPRSFDQRRKRAPGAVCCR